MENKLVPIRALLGELYLAAGKGKEALVEFEAADKVMPNRFRIVAGAARAARESDSVEAAKRYYQALTALVAGGGGEASSRSAAWRIVAIAASCWPSEKEIHAAAACFWIRVCPAQ